MFAGLVHYLPSHQVFMDRSPRKGILNEPSLNRETADEATFHWWKPDSKSKNACHL